MADEPTVTEPEEKLPLTMIEVWDELSDIERNALAELAQIGQGQLALTRISSLLKAIYYKYYYGNPKAYSPGTVVQSGATQSPHAHGLSHGGASIGSMVAQSHRAYQAQQAVNAVNQHQIALQQQHLLQMAHQGTPGVAHSHPLQPSSLWRKFLGY